MSAPADSLRVEDGSFVASYLKMRCAQIQSELGGGPLPPGVIDLVAAAAQALSDSKHYRAIAASRGDLAAARQAAALAADAAKIEREALTIATRESRLAGGAR